MGRADSEASSSVYYSSRRFEQCDSGHSDATSTIIDTSPPYVPPGLGSGRMQGTYIEAEESRELSVVSESVAPSRVSSSLVIDTSSLHPDRVNDSTRTSSEPSSEQQSAFDSMKVYISK